MRVDECHPALLPSRHNVKHGGIAVVLLDAIVGVGAVIRRVTLAFIFQPNAVAVETPACQRVAKLEGRMMLFKVESRCSNHLRQTRHVCILLYVSSVVESN